MIFFDNCRYLRLCWAKIEVLIVSFSTVGSSQWSAKNRLQINFLGSGCSTHSVFVCLGRLGLAKAERVPFLSKICCKKGRFRFCLFGDLWQFGIFKKILLGCSTWLRAVGHLLQGSGPVCDRFLVGEDLKRAQKGKGEPEGPAAVQPLIPPLAPLVLEPTRKLPSD